MTDHSVLLLAYGQSNADLYPAAPALQCDAFEDTRIVTFDDGHAFRGFLGAVPKTTASALVPAAAASYESRKCRNYQSFQIAAGARLLREHHDDHLRHVIIRAEGRGGRRFHGITAKNGNHVEGILTNRDGSESQILLNMLRAIRTADDLARQAGAPLRRILVNFIHGEADRGTRRDAYTENFQKLIARVDLEARALGLPVDWLILDPAGTSISGSGNRWPCRLAMRDVADTTANVHLIGAGYAYPLDDTIHYSAESRALFGEHFGAAAAQLLSSSDEKDAGRSWLLSAPRVENAVLKDSLVEIHLSGTEEFELVPDISDSNLTIEGFSTTVSSRCSVLAARQTGPQSVEVVLDRAPATTDRRAALTYAFHIVTRTDKRAASPMPAGRGGWRSIRSIQSIALPDRHVHQWVPGFILPFDQMQRG